MSNAAAGYYDDGTGRQRWWDGGQWTEHYAPTVTAEPTAPAAPTADAPLYQFTSHIEGKNATVQIWPDRIEWGRKAVSGGKLAAGVLTAGISTMFTGLRGHDTDMLPMSSVTSVTSKKGMGLNTVVSVRTAAGVLEFRVSHKEASAARDVLNRLILARR